MGGTCPGFSDARVSSALHRYHAFATKHQETRCLVRTEALARRALYRFLYR